MLESAEEASFRQEVRNFVATRLPDDIRAKVRMFQPLQKDDIGRWHRILNERGWGVPAWPEEFGGPGWTPTQRAIFDEEAALGGAPRLYPHVNMIGPVLQRFGTPAQQQRFLPKIRSMEEWWCQGYSEPGAGSDLASLKTRAQRTGDVYRVSGQKIWTSFALWADWMFCLVRTDSTGKPQQGISFLLIDMRSKGITVRPIRTLTGGDLTEVFLDDVEVPLENLVHQENDGWTVAKFLLGFERTTLAAVGLCKFMFNRTKELAAESGNGLLMEDPGFRRRLAAAEVDIIAHEWTLKRVLGSKAAAQGGAASSVLKIKASEIQQALAELLLECAGAGAMRDARSMKEKHSQPPAAGIFQSALLADLYLDIRKTTIFGGTSEVQKNIIAKSLLGL